MVGYLWIIAEQMGTQLQCIQIHLLLLIKMAVGLCIQVLESVDSPKIFCLEIFRGMQFGHCNNIRKWIKYKESGDDTVIQRMSQCDKIYRIFR